MLSLLSISAPRSSARRCCVFLASVLALLLGPAWLSAAPPLSPREYDLVKNAEAQRVEAIAKVYGAVVAIYGNDRQGGGSGVLYHEAGLALTNHHVVAAAGKEGWAGLADGKLYRWQLVGTDPGGDLAIIRLAGQTKFPCARLADSNTVRVGDWAMAMGNPFVLAEDQSPTVTLGIVSGVKRYQPGDGLNMLVYGNCIQVDSSINPGNSGGPLFNLRGEVIGINGRGSFEERGRVNVGLGYAISSNQAKHFIPELLATKLAQHGTLDCQFGNRTGGVICQAINLSSPVAEAGLELGDRLVSFEGEPINSANEFTNLITTLPADWPCELTFARGDQLKTVHVRLTPLPYETPRQQGPRRPAPEPKPEEPKPDDNKPTEPMPGEQPEAKAPPPAALPPGKPGQPLFPELSREHAALLLRENPRRQSFVEPSAWKIQEQWFEGDQPVGTVSRTVAHDGRFVVEARRNGEDPWRVGFTGEKFWKIDGEEKSADLSFERAMREPIALQTCALGVVRAGRVEAGHGQLSLGGADKAQRQIAYRLACGPAEQDPVYLWLSLLNESGELESRLLKSGIGIHHDEPVPSSLFREWQTTAGLAWPGKIDLVRGLNEEPVGQLRLETIESVRWQDSLFEMQ